jgi:hypothetical protein
MKNKIIGVNFVGNDNGILLMLKNSNEIFPRSFEYKYCDNNKLSIIDENGDREEILMCEVFKFKNVNFIKKCQDVYLCTNTLKYSLDLDDLCDCHPCEDCYNTYKFLTEYLHLLNL